MNVSYTRLEEFDNRRGSRDNNVSDAVDSIGRQWDVVPQFTDRDRMRWIIGDVHGMLRPLEALLREVQRLDARARFFFVGDYVNRGPDSRGVVDLLISLKTARCIRGNHDDIFDHILNARSYAPMDGDPLLSFQRFMGHGLDATFQSYGVDPAELEFCNHRPTMARLQQIIASVPPAHREFFRDLPALIEEPDLFIAHAKWEPGEMDVSPPMNRQLADDAELRDQLIWGRFSKHELYLKKAWSRTGYFGHTPVYAYAPGEVEEQPFLPIAGEKIVLLDTGAALNPMGRLTAFCPEERIFIQSDRRGNIVEA